MATTAAPSSARPRLTDLVTEPFHLTIRQRATAFGRPLPPLAAVVLGAVRGWWLLEVVAVPVLFAADVVVLHDLFHRNLGLPARLNSALVGLYGALLLNSGHALNVTHLQHHRVFPGGDDPEAYVDGWPWWRVLVECPVYRFHAWAWAWRRAPGRRPLVLAEGAVWAGAWVLAISLRHACPGIAVFVVVAELGTWSFPLISVVAVHDRSGPGPLEQTKTLHAAIADRLMLGMQYHLEHHLYPRVPAPRLAELAAALEPWMAAEDGPA